MVSKLEVCLKISRSMFNIRILILAILFSSVSCYSINKKSYPDINNVKLVSVYDGDTFKVDIKDYPAIISSRISIRINGINSPEIRGGTLETKARARKAKRFLKSILKNAKKIELKNIQRGKYFRIVADVYADNQNVADLLIKHGHASRYSITKKKKRS